MPFIGPWESELLLQDHRPERISHRVSRIINQSEMNAESKLVVFFILDTN